METGAAYLVVASPIRNVSMTRSPPSCTASSPFFSQFMHMSARPPHRETFIRLLSDLRVSTKPIGVRVVEGELKPPTKSGIVRTSEHSHACARGVANTRRANRTELPSVGARLEGGAHRPQASRCQHFFYLLYSGRRILWPQQRSQHANPRLVYFGLHPTLAL